MEEWEFEIILALLSIIILLLYLTGYESIKRLGITIEASNKEIKETKRLLQELSGNEVPDDCKKRLESAALEKDWERYDLIEMEARNRSTLCRVEDNLENLRKLFREEMSRLRRNLKGEP